MFLGLGLLGVQGFRVQVGIPGFRDSCFCGLGFRLGFDVVDVRSNSTNPTPQTANPQAQTHTNPTHFELVDPQLAFIPPPLQKIRSLSFRTETPTHEKFQNLSRYPPKSITLTNPKIEPLHSQAPKTRNPFPSPQVPCTLTPQNLMKTETPKPTRMRKERFHCGSCW